MTDLQKDSLTLPSTYVTVNNKSTEAEARDCRNIGFYEKREKNVQKKEKVIEEKGAENLNFHFQ